MNRLRHDLLTSGWSMIDCSEYLAAFNQNWVEAPHLEFKYWGLLPQIYRDFAGKMDWLLHEALPEENFRATRMLAISNWSNHGWHQDLGYLQVLFAPRGYGTTAALGYNNNVTTPHGYALIMSGTYRAYRRNIPATWHTSPHCAWERRLFFLTFS